MGHVTAIASALILLINGSVTAQELPGPATILRLTGRVLDGESLDGVGSAIVSIVRQGRTIGQDTADARGNYLIEVPYESGVEADAVRTSAKGYLPQSPYLHLDCGVAINRPGEQQYCTYEANQYLQSSEALFTSSGTTCPLQGRVVDRKGRQIGYAMVTIDGELTPVTANAEGEFELESVAAGIRSATVAAIGYYQHAKAVLIACGSARQMSVIIQLFEAMLH